MWNYRNHGPHFGQNFSRIWINSPEIQGLWFKIQSRIKCQKTNPSSADTSDSLFVINFCQWAGPGFLRPLISALGVARRPAVTDILMLDSCKFRFQDPYLFFQDPHLYTFDRHLP